MSNRMSAEQVSRRRAVEALRSGVPSWDAVAALGSGQPEAEDRFTALLSALDGSIPASGASTALLVGGGFGSGKSHLLTHLAHLALSAGFVVSTVVISKETPLHDPVKTFRAAVHGAVGPGRTHGVVSDAAASLDADSPRYAELSRWLNAQSGAPDERFAATLLCHERLRGGEVPGSDETVDALVRFWAGDPLRVSDLRRALRAVGAGGMYTFSPISARDLARQRFRFIARLLRAAGHAGWVILFDEVELIGRYTLLQRGRSYAEVARWLDGDAAQRAPLVGVLAMTDDFEAAVLSGKDDRGQVPAKLRGRETPEWDETATLAEAGMRHIDRDMLLLSPPDRGELDRAYSTIKQLHAAAFGWSPPDVSGLERLGATRMRQYVRAWINEWDLIRLDPGYQPQSEAIQIASDYREDEALGGSASGDDHDEPG
ncbi:MAG TPA: BREX system ATP-binding domain-containing protein [Mycobacteriales bacterium]|nr:BREX system ATP-binding domain-containing protein [Mycobacteriales bacterium]